MRWLFMLCNNCNERGQASKYWIVDNHHCTCIFLEVADEQE